MEAYVIYYHPTGYLVPGFEQDMIEISRCSDGIVFPVYESEILADAYPEEMKRGFEFVRAQGKAVVVSFALGNVFARFWPSEFAQSHWDTWVEKPDGSKLPRCCVNNPVFRKFTHDFLESFLSKYPVDAVFLDEPSVVICSCRYCREKYLEQNGVGMPVDKDENMTEFCQTSTTDYLSSICSIAKSHALRTFCCLIPWCVDFRFAQSVGRLENLDVFGIDPYWWWPGNQKDLAWFADTVHAFRACVSRGQSYMVWIQNFCLPQGREMEVAEAVELAVHDKVDILGAMYYWRGLANPRLAWEYTAKALSRSRRARDLR